MRIFVKVWIAGSDAQSYVIPCKEPADSVGLLKRAALERWAESNALKSGGASEQNADEFQLTLSGNGAVLSDKDAIQDVLQDGEFVNLCKQTTYPMSGTNLL